MSRKVSVVTPLRNSVTVPRRSLVETSKGQERKIFPKIPVPESESTSPGRHFTHVHVHVRREVGVTSVIQYNQKRGRRVR